MFFNRSSKSKSIEPATPRSAISHDLKATRKAGIRTAIMVTLLVSGVVPAVCMMFSSTDDAIPFSQYLQQMWTIALLTYPLTIVVALLTILRKRGVLSFGNLFLTVSIVIFCGSVGNAIGVLGGHEAQQAQPTNQQFSNVAGFTNSPGFSNGQNMGFSNGNFQPAGFGNTANVNNGFGNPAQGGYQRETYYDNASLYSGSRVPSAQSTAYNPRQPDRRSPGILLGIPAACFGFFSSYYKIYGMRTFLASVLVGMFAGNTASRFLVHVPKNRNETVGLAKSFLRKQ